MRRLITTAYAKAAEPLPRAKPLPRRVRPRAPEKQAAFDAWREEQERVARAVEDLEDP